MGEAVVSMLQYVEVGLEVLAGFYAYAYLRVEQPVRKCREQQTTELRI